jgi:hypothetical protein
VQVEHLPQRLRLEFFLLMVLVLVGWGYFALRAVLPLIGV